ncbi:MAG: hypothetical protein A3C08_00880 [Candidatus Taylorbacteria bacterium RIFCSPHIGHO2_02_FULL_47_18]|uniref:DUF11 domain-containing protein n=1 Tax=Candidatus Taylorbacteria bacterium RIFCSPLOWO2_01_FULL_48_100 TaxID=1802322 RepID=A0A1G2NES8_9BACT|nr:MAG: hypothetical protein A2670_03075 [Candidatus Taylorbacteria bacterium RIFCSPHIGHO2_01_FULL_48_38]OHA27523.1 MAG: hypothetical protein A3C08_00880 [Candidatus Taylorbacteria bacterium RIFCSPHIGHO2_02_FULL_47_18]OHA34587.1 MAG: hypothetical protein A2938_03500 [Candidatus Taylorbacteria bacterium RIFCSPLOWO2_01_FULL_48_100]OHA40350.1 MAG: hypothetical protein A3J31_01975 [Candidatus Taylorbacteria bacterium RIFCSPLOWO2_02_FULL_48_16]OHA45225.1 MAG: hypothetical protein A3H13_02520 [Candid
MDGLEKIRKGLYAREQEPNENENTQHSPLFHSEKIESKSSWEREPLSPETPTVELRNAMSLAKKLFIGSAIFFACAVAFAGFVMFRGGNVVSSEKVFVQFAGPLSVAGGEPFNFEVSVRNDNSSQIEAADLLLEFPEGTRRANNPLAEMRRFREALGEIAPGESLSKKHEAILFGEEGEHLVISATLEYRVRGSNALLKKTSRYEVALGTAPLSISITGMRETANKSEFSLELEVKSNSTTALRDIIVEADYPFGFAFKNSSPRPTSGERAWALGDLSAGGTRRITLSGIVSGAEGDERVFRFRAGPAQSGSGSNIGTALVSASHAVLLRRPFLAISLIVNGEEGTEFITEKGKTVRVGVAWENNLPTRATDAQITVRLDGALYDPASVVPDGGSYYRAQDGTIVWDRSADGSLATMEPGARGQKQFSVNVRGPGTGVYALKNPSFGISASISARGPAGASEAGGAIETKTRAEVKLLADLSLSARLARWSGTFTNRGPIPPKVGEETTYTVVWSLSNAFNELSDARVSATLPSYVRFVGAVSPAGERVSYDAISGVVMWEAGEVKAGVGIGGIPREVAFQVALVPASSQAGSIPTLVGEASAEGNDRFTGRSVSSATRPALSTAFSDASFVSGQDVVGK